MMMKFGITIPEKFWNNTDPAKNKPFLKGKYEIQLNVPGLNYILGREYKVLPINDVKLPMEKNVVLKEVSQVDDFLFCVIDIRENPIPLIALLGGILTVTGLSALGFTVLQVRKLIEVSPLTLIIVAGIIIFIGFKKWLR